MSWLRRHRWWVAIAVVYLYVFPHFPRLHSANEMPRVYLVKAIADHHTFAIDDEVQRWGATADVSTYGGHSFSNKAPGSSMLVVPVYAAVALIAGEPSLDTTVWISRVVAGVIPTLLFLVLLYGFLERFAPDPDVRKLVVVAYALGSMAMTYSVLFIAHQLSAVCLASAWILALDVADKRRGPLVMIAVGLLAGAAPLVDYQAAFALPFLCAHVIYRLRALPRPELARAIATVAAAAAVPIAVLLAYHATCFGSPWRTGYDASETFAVFHQKGFLGITKLRWEAFAGSTVDPSNGLVTLAPWLLIAIPGAVALWRRGARDVVITCGAIAVVFLLFISSINFWRGGWGVGPRYITAMLPFLLPMIAAQLEAWRPRWWAIGVCAGAMLVGIAIYTLSSATFPHWPDTMRNPFYECTLRLIGDGYVAPNFGTARHLPPLVSLVPYLALIGGVFGVTVLRLATWRGLVLSVGVGLAILIGYRAFPSTKDADLRYQRVTSFFPDAHVASPDHLDR